MKMCGKCFSEVKELFEPNCLEKPELLNGMAIGMYHCPDCGIMLLAGVEHPKVCKQCLNEKGEK
jgi:hypothetical protein